MITKRCVLCGKSFEIRILFPGEEERLQGTGAICPRCLAAIAVVQRAVAEERCWMKKENDDAKG